MALWRAAFAAALVVFLSIAGSASGKGGPPPPPPAPPGGTGTILFSTDPDPGTLVALPKSDVFTLASDSLTPVQLTSSPAHESAAAGSPNGRRIVTIHWSSVDPAPSSGDPTQPPDTIASAEGASLVYTSDPSCDPDGNCATGTSTVSLDRTAPTVAYSGNAGTYTVDQQVGITCSASDGLSGLASSTCADVSGPAYSFALGTNSFSASGTDRAGNVGEATATFTVRVTPASLCVLTLRVLQSHGLARGVDPALCGRLDNPQLVAFVSRLLAQAGTSLDAVEAQLLRRLVAML